MRVLFRDSACIEQFDTGRSRANRMFHWLANRLILEATTEPLDPEQRQRHVIRVGAGTAELWSLDHEPVAESAARVAVLKFPGTGGRAERVREHPLECWPRVAATIYAVNPPGYGTSGGRPSVDHLPTTAAAAYHFVRARHRDEPLFVVGNSLGCLSALYVAARWPLNALYLRNPAPVHQLIRQRWKYNWWNGGLARCIAAQVPADLDAYANARQASAPCLLVTSERDRIAPPRFQNALAAVYAGPLKQLTLLAAAHHDPVPEEQLNEYRMTLDWLWERLHASGTDEVRNRLIEGKIP